MFLVAATERRLRQFDFRSEVVVVVFVVTDGIVFSGSVHHPAGAVQVVFGPHRRRLSDRRNGGSGGGGRRCGRGGAGALLQLLLSQFNGGRQRLDADVRRLRQAVYRVAH